MFTECLQCAITVVSALHELIYHGYTCYYSQFTDEEAEPQSG